MSIIKLKKYDNLVAEELQSYCKRLRFTESLTDLVAATLYRSITLGDGALWSDSFLITSLIKERNLLRTTFDNFPGLRSELILSKSFYNTLSTAHLEISPSFQNILTELLYKRAFDNRDEKINEAGLVLLELENSLYTYLDNYHFVSSFISEITKPIYDRATYYCDENRSSFSRLATLLEDCVSICFMSFVHPFYAFKKMPILPYDINNKKQRAIEQIRSMKNIIPRHNFNKNRMFFYAYLRDLAGVKPGLLEGKELESVACAFRYSEFEFVCDSIEEEINPSKKNSIFDEDYEEKDDESPEELYEDGFYIASMLRSTGLPLSTVAQKLSFWRYKHHGEELWPKDSKLVISIGERAIQVSRMDVSSPTTFTSQNVSVRRSLAEVGIWTPSPLWTDSVIERFEYLINNGHIKEQEVQSFFELYPDFIIDELHVEALPQVILFQESGQHLRPDFLVRRSDSQYVDIVELKRPNAQNYFGTPNRPYLATEVTRAIAQLLEYKNWFKNPQNRKWLREKYGIDGFEPRLTLVIGRSLPWVNDEVRAKALSGAEATILTYDDLASVVKRRRNWLTT